MNNYVRGQKCSKVEDVMWASECLATRGVSVETECFLRAPLGGREARDWVDSIPSIPIPNATG